VLSVKFVYVFVCLTARLMYHTTQSECSMPFNFLCYAVPYNDRYTLLFENISLYFVLQQIFFVPFSSFLVPSFREKFNKINVLCVTEIKSYITTAGCKIK
jgi:hypothetical protein